MRYLSRLINLKDGFFKCNYSMIGSYLSTSPSAPILGGCLVTLVAGMADTSSLTLLAMRCIANVLCCHGTAKFSGGCKLNCHFRDFLGLALLFLCPTQRHAYFSIVVTSISPRRQHVKNLLLTPVGRAVSILTNQAIALNCWKRILHGSLLFLHFEMRH